MAAQKGSAYLLKIGDGSGPESFTTIAGMRSIDMRRNRQPVDVSSADDSGEARALLTAAGRKDMEVSFEGVFTDAAPDSTLETDFEAGTLRNFQIVVPDFGTYEGGFIITALNQSGRFEGEVTFSMTLMSGDAWSFTAA